MKSVTRSLSGGLSLLAALTLASCAESSDPKGARPAPTANAGAPAAIARPPATGEAANRHWVQSAQLRDLMQGISTITQREWPNGIPENPEDPQARDVNKQIAAAAKLADALAAAAVHIPESLSARSMSEADRAGFQAEADILRDQALRLGQAAHDRKIEQMQKSLEALNATCLSCHSRYRDFTGQLDVQRAYLPKAQGACSLGMRTRI